MTDDPIADIAALRARLAAGMPVATPERELPPPLPPIYLLSVDTPDERSIVLVVGQGGDGIWMATIALPQWHELPEGWDGPMRWKRPSGWRTSTRLPTGTMPSR